MMKTLVAAGLLSAMLGFAPAQAASGQIDSFSASATSVLAGNSVDFSASFGVITYASSYGGSNPAEPEPAEGQQYWDINFYGYDNETLSEVWLQAGSASYSEFPAAAPGSSTSGSWAFSMLFPTAGTFVITLDGGWRSQVESGYSGESAFRDCYYTSDDGSGPLSCNSWTYEYSDYSDNYDSDGLFGPHSLTIEVLAVPEPQSLALWLVGGVVLLVRRRLV